MKSITSDMKRYYNKLSRAAVLKARRRRELGCLPSFDWRKSFEALPVVITARTYQREFFASDLAAGLTEVCMYHRRRVRVRVTVGVRVRAGLTGVCVYHRVRVRVGLRVEVRVSAGLTEVCVYHAKCVGVYIDPGPALRSREADTRRSCVASTPM